MTQKEQILKLIENRIEELIQLRIDCRKDKGTAHLVDTINSHIFALNELSLDIQAKID